MGVKFFRLGAALILLVVLMGSGGQAGLIQVSGFSYAENSPPDAPCGSVIFSDDFRNPQSGWISGDAGGASWGYTGDGEYRVLTMSDYTIAWSWAPREPLGSNFCLEIDAKQLVSGSLSSHGEIGLIYGGNKPAGSFNLFGIRYPDRAYHVGSFDPSPSLQGTAQSSPSAIKPLNEFNHLLIVARGGQANFYINNISVAQVNTGTSGSVGVFALTFEASNVDGHFAHFVVRELH